MAGRDPAEEPRKARDVMAFGQEVGRVLSDGRIVGRAEPFAKVFASSRAVKRAVGLAAWGVLEDIALDARLDDRGRLVAETNVRRIAANLGLNKDTVAKHLRTLREHGFVLQEEERAAGSGRYEVCRYVLDPAACVERFTVTPTQPAGEPCPGSSDTASGGPVSEGTGHGGTGHGDLGQVCS
jgi:DNA-binding transcriptional ArsR family regulator